MKVLYKQRGRNYSVISVMFMHMPHRKDEREIFSKGRFLLKDIDLELDDGSRVTYQMWDKPDTAMIVPVTDDGEVIFVTEYHAAIDEKILSLPKGRVEDGELSEDTAKKELQEEIGYKATQLEKVSTLRSIPGYINTRTHVYLARGLEESALEGDEEWELPTTLYPLSEFEKLIDERKLSEARVITALYEARRAIS